jgi:D-alanyl-D-alanine carboxypeptidase
VVKVKDIYLDFYEITLYVGKDHTPTVTVFPSDAENKAVRLESDNSAVALIKDEKTISARRAGNCNVWVISEDDPTVKTKISVTVLHTPEGEITYIEGVLIANKTYALPSDYDPGVDPTAKSALSKMIAAAKKDGIKLWICSGYRDYDLQSRLYNNYVKKDGKEKADTYSARPGHSEHQSGLAFDLNRTDSSFNGTPEALWIAANAHKYGFIVRYPEGKMDITGYKYEPWHVRYLGVELATSVYESGLTLEEYLGIDSVYADLRD